MKSSPGYADKVAPNPRAMLLVLVLCAHIACLEWMRDRQYRKPSKSSCIFFPFRGDDQWRDMRENHPEDWSRACEIDRQIRPGFFGMEGEAFVHRQRVPLADVDLSTAADHGQIEFGFLQECDGVCGV